MRTLPTLLALTIALFPATVRAVKINDLPPPAKATNQDGKTVNLAEHYGARPVVLFFYPKSFTPGCTKEVQAFRDERQKLEAFDAALYGVSQDNAGTQRKFCDEYKLNYDLLADEGGKIAQAFGVPVQGVASARWTVVIGRAGKVILVDQNVKADIVGHPAKITDILEKDWKTYVEQFKPLFDGKSLEGLHTFAAEADTWQVRDGLLTCSGKPTSYIRNLRPMRDYRLLVEFRYTEVVGNSGVLVHAQGEDRVWPTSIEPNLNVDQMGKFYFIHGATGEVIGDNPLCNVDVKPKTWNRFEIVCRQDTINVWLNGVKVSEARKVKPSEGLIGIQAEGVPFEIRVWAVRPLPVETASGE